MRNTIFTLRICGGQNMSVFRRALDNTALRTIFQARAIIKTAPYGENFSII